MRKEENFCRQFASEKVNFFRNLKKRIASLILHLLNYVHKWYIFECQTEC